MEVNKKDLEKVYDHLQEKIGRVPDHFKTLSEHNPEALLGFYHIRNSTMYNPPEGAILKKNKEIIITAVECAIKIPAEGHARQAIRDGATIEELHEALTMVLWLTGITTYAHYCRPALLAAEDEVKKINSNVTQ